MITREYNSNIDTSYKRVYYTVSAMVSNDFMNIIFYYNEFTNNPFSTLNRIDSSYNVYYFVTLKKEKIPTNIEELLIEKIYKNINKTINIKKKELISVPKEIKEDIKKCEKYLNNDIFNHINRKKKLESL